MATALSQFYPFATGAGSNVTEAQWRQMARLWRTTGVVPAAESGLNELAVAQRGAGANMSVDVASGWAWIVGEFGALAALTNVGITANATGNPRIDLVVLRADFVNDVVELDVLVGTPAVAPVEPALTQTTSVWEIALAAVDVAAAAASILTANIRDRRTLTLSPPQLANKEPARVATTTALAASTVTGITRVANANGALAAIDGVTLVAGDRLLDKDHATTAQRGLWRVVDPGSASRPWIMERPPDFASSSDVRAATWVKVAEGTTNADTGWLLTTNDPIVLGTTGLAFSQFPGPGTVTFRGCSIYRSSTQTITTGTNTVIAMTAESIDTDGFHDNAVNNSRATIPTGLGGKYLVNAKGDWSPNVTGRRTVMVRKNGAGGMLIVHNNGMATGEDVGDNTHIFVAKMLELAVGDYLELLLLQTSGADRLIGGDANATYLELIYLGV